jgi:hypothetical protein
MAKSFVAEKIISIVAEEILVVTTSLGVATPAVGNKIYSMFLDGSQNTDRLAKLMLSSSFFPH